MRTKVCISLCALSLFWLMPAQAQNYYLNNGPLSDSLVRKTGVAQLDMHTVYVYKRFETTTRKTYMYDQSGRQIFNCSVHDTQKLNRLNYAQHNVYTGKGNQGSVFHYGEGRKSTIKLTDYNSNGKVASIRYYHKGRRLSTRSEFAYRDSLLIRMSNYKRSGKLRTYYAYTYEGKKLATYALYNKKGKLVRLWDYTCTDEAKAVKPGKDTVKICTEKSYRADGTVVITTNSFNFRGEPVKYVEIQDSLKRTLSYRTYQGKNEILVFRQLYTYEGKTFSGSYVWWGDSKGRANYSVTKSYNSLGQTTSETDSNFNRKIPEVKAFAFQFDSNGMLSVKTGKVNGHIKSIDYYRYRYYRKD